MVGHNITSAVAEVADVFLSKAHILCNICNKYFLWDTEY